MTSSLRESTSLNNEIIRKKYFLIAKDTANSYSPPVQKQEIPYIDFSPLQNAIISLGRAADHSFEAMNTKGMTGKQMDSLNRMLYRAEQELLLDQGLPLRPWYKHVLYAPGFYTGYSVKTLPGIRESIEQRNFLQAEIEIKRAAFSINKLAGYLQQL
jgi:N-acetylated-alpha-linked acidic dipeptidase